MYKWIEFDKLNLSTMLRGVIRQFVSINGLTLPLIRFKTLVHLQHQNYRNETKLFEPVLALPIHLFQIYWIIFHLLEYLEIISFPIIEKWKNDARVEAIKQIFSRYKLIEPSKHIVVMQIRCESRIKCFVGRKWWNDLSEQTDSWSLKISLEWKCFLNAFKKHFHGNNKIVLIFLPITPTKFL